MTITYVWKEPFTPFAGVKGSDPQVVGESIQRIKDDHGGQLKPRYIWTAAKSPRHPLHKYGWSWDVQEAAELHWDHVARKLAGSIIVLTDDDRPDDSSGPAFISINAKEGVSYKTLGEVLDSNDLQVRLLEQAGKELKAFERRYQMLRDVCEVISTARALIEKKKKRPKRKRKDDDDRPRPSA